MVSGVSLVKSEIHSIEGGKNLYLVVMMVVSFHLLTVSVVGRTTWGASRSGSNERISLELYMVAQLRPRHREVGSQL